MRDVIRPEVENRSATVLEEERRVGVPVLHTVRQHRGGAGNRDADTAGVDCIATGLVRGAEERIRRTADPEAFRGGRLHHRLRRGKARGERLFQIDVLARLDDLQRHRCMRGRDSEVHHDLDIGIGEQRIDCNCVHAVFMRFSLGGVGADVGH